MGVCRAFTATVLAQQRASIRSRLARKESRFCVRYKRSCTSWIFLYSLLTASPQHPRKSYGVSYGFGVRGSEDGGC
ncbi:Hypothetical protein, putative [Bodo saltans]|uniref:Uncharacterized protein n=1 Tax=Bodo saltans TaxID=75058 RepID=A0A0S4J534_BODSA|nr:Hypothetical protein, putative [Bodo saltans]|eukprot:CUG80224.1 Hypothetical protein, putative [Bodo saltans]